MQRRVILTVLMCALPAIALAQTPTPTPTPTQPDTKTPAQPQAQTQTRCYQTLGGISCMATPVESAAPKSESLSRDLGAQFPAPNINAYAVQPPLYAPALFPARTQCWPTESSMDCIVVR